MYVAVVPNRNSPPAILLREGYRENGKVKNRTLANLSKWPPEKIEALKRALKGTGESGGGSEAITSEALFESVSSRQHGHVKAVLLAMQRLGIAKVLDTRGSRERDLVLALIAGRIMKPASKLGMHRSGSDTTLLEELGLEGSDEDDLYAAMDWLLERQAKVEQKLAARHLSEGGLVLYDLTSSYFEGTRCPLAKLGYSRDGKKGKLQVNYGLLTDARGCPVSVSVFEGNTADATTFLPQVAKVREDFKVSEVVLVGDRGMISQKQVEGLREQNGVAWLTALKTGAIRGLVESGSMQLGLFDERGLFELEHPDYPGERLIACRNPELAKRRAHTRESLLAATTQALEEVGRMVASGRLTGAAEVGVRVGKVVNKHKVAKHFVLDIGDERFDFKRDEARIQAEAALDGVYVVRTSLPAARMSAAEVVRNYKNLSRVERAFRSMKTMDLKVRPIHHYTEARVRAHIFLCMLAYYVEWHMREVLKPLLFDDEDQAAKAQRDPVAPAKRSAEANAKASKKKTADGYPVHSFRTLIDHLGAIVRNACTRKGEPLDTCAKVTIETTPGPVQKRAFELLASIQM